MRLYSASGHWDKIHAFFSKHADFYRSFSKNPQIRKQAKSTTQQQSDGKDNVKNFIPHEPVGEYHASSRGGEKSHFSA